MVSPTLGVVLLRLSTLIPVATPQSVLPRLVGEVELDVTEVEVEFEPLELELELLELLELELLEVEVEVVVSACAAETPAKRAGPAAPEAMVAKSVITTNPFATTRLDVKN